METHHKPLNGPTTDRHGRTVEFMLTEHAKTISEVAHAKAKIARLTAELHLAESQLRSLEIQAAFEDGIFEGLGVH